MPTPSEQSILISLLLCDTQGLTRIHGSKDVGIRCLCRVSTYGSAICNCLTSFSFCMLGELYSLVRFLRVFPWAYYFCKARAHVGNRCDCNSLDHLFKKDRKRCDNCGYASCCWFLRTGPYA